MTEEELKELIIKAKSGDSFAMDNLLNSHKQLVNFVIRHYFLMGGDIDDLTQEGMIGLFKAINTFDFSKNVSFETYAKTIIERQVINAIKADSSLKNSVLNYSYGLTNQGSVNFLEEDSGYMIPTNEVTPENKIIFNEQTKELLSQIRMVLSTFELKVINLYFKGLSYIDIAKELNVSSKSIDNALTRIKSKLKFLKRG